MSLTARPSTAGDQLRARLSSMKPLWEVFKMRFMEPSIGFACFCEGSRGLFSFFHVYSLQFSLVLLSSLFLADFLSIQFFIFLFPFFCFSNTCRYFEYVSCIFRIHAEHFLYTLNIF